MAVSLAHWLRSRTPPQLAAILRSRPDTLGPPAPGHLSELARRLGSPPSVAMAMWALPRPGWEVVEVLQLLGPADATPAAVAAWLGRPAADPAVTASLASLADRAIAWPDGPGLRLPDPLYGLAPRPLGLGPSAADLLRHQAATPLRGAARELGLPPAGRKPELVAQVADQLADPVFVRKLVAGAPRATRERLHELAWARPDPDGFGRVGGWYRTGPDPRLAWAADRALVLPDELGLAQLPREVAVALRGPDWHAPFTPEPPVPARAPVAGEAVEREAAAAGAAAVDQLAALLEAIAAAPVALLKTGGVGVRELRRLARTVGQEEGAVRLWLELAYHAGLVDPEFAKDHAAGRLLPTDRYDEWAGTGPAERLAAVLPTWLALPSAPLLPPAPDAKPLPALVPLEDGPPLAALRRQLLAALAGLPAGTAATDPAGLAPVVGWFAPLVVDPVPDAGALVAALCREAQLVGVLAHGALTPPGRALAGEPPGEPGAGPPGEPGAGPPGEPASGPADGLPDRLADSCRRLLPPAVGEAVFQADLTALVPGTPEHPLARLLDSAAERESRGGATTWRFTPDSVRRALDRGQSGEALLACLRERAAGGELPQPLRYLVTDVARRHGAVRVRSVASLLRVEDRSLANELAGARSLRSLGLSKVAPTVLASAAPVAETLAVLRAAGYAPAVESPDGVIRPEPVPHPRTSRAPAARPRSGPRRPTVPVTVAALAERLLATPDPPAPVPGDPAFLTDRDLDAELDELAGHLPAAERRLLGHAIEAELPIEISYTDGQGNSSQRVIEPLELDGPHLIAWCRLRGDERMFFLPRFDSVAPA